MCLPCEPGFFRADATTTTCAECSAGTWSYRGNTACVGCYAGRFTNTSAATTCQACGPNTFLATTIATTEHTLTVCSACSKGETSVLGAAECQVCPYGFEGIGDGLGCTPCSPGKYKLINTDTLGDITTCTSLFDKTTRNDEIIRGYGATSDNGEQCPRGRQASALYSACEFCTPPAPSSAMALSCFPSPVRWCAVDQVPPARLLRARARLSLYPSRAPLAKQVCL